MTSSLSMGYPEFLGRVGIYLGYGGSPTGDELSDCQRIIDAGMRKFYAAHNWYFLNVTATLTLVAAQDYVDLPDNFGTPISLNMPGGTYRTRPKFVQPEKIEELRGSYTVAAEEPQYFAIRAKTSDQSADQKYEMIFWPEPNDSYAMVFKYRAIPERVRAATPYPLGGEHHAETMMEFILAQAELERDDERGIHAQEMMQMLQLSLKVDAELAPTFHGYNGDHSDSMYEWDNNDSFYRSRITRSYTY